MRLSEFENEDALDLLANIIEPAAEIMQDKKIVALVRSGKPVLYAVAEILRSHKKQAIEIVSALHKKKPGEYTFTAVSLTNDVIELMNDPEIQMVFTSQSPTATAEPSGSATESTEG